MWIIIEDNSELLIQGMHKFAIPSKAVIESISMSSAGDIRGAINALQFACLKGKINRKY